MIVYLKSACRQAALAVYLSMLLCGYQSAYGADPTFPFTKVVVPGATCAAVSDENNTLVVGRTGDATEDLRVYGLLAEKGLIKTGTPQKVLLTKAAGLEKVTVRPLSLVFHPKLPLLYVWSDVFTQPPNTPIEKLVYDKYDHLSVFKIANSQLQLVGTFGHGPDFSQGKTLGNIAIDPQGTRIFLPNLRDPKTGFVDIGFLDLDKDGIPVSVPVTIPGALDAFGVEKQELQHRPTRVTIQIDQNNPFPAYSTGLYAPNANVVLYGTYGGPGFWDTTNRRAALGSYYYRPIYSSCRVGGHPKFRHVYMCAGDLNNVNLAMMTHADGFLTLIARTGPTVSGEVHFHSNPVVMPGQKRHRMAIGGVNTVYVFPLDILGEFDGPPERITVVAPAAKAIAYSDKHERLYVAVEKP